MILALANGISILTSISLSAIATNIKVKGGGDYYLISRTLGPEFGGALGIVLFLAQSVSIGFYCIGFGEVLAQILPLPALGSYGPQMPSRAVAVDLPFCAGLAGCRLGHPFSVSGHGVLWRWRSISFLGVESYNGSPQIWRSNWRGPLNGPGFWILFRHFLSPP